MGNFTQSSFGRVFLFALAFLDTHSAWALDPFLRTVDPKKAMKPTSFGGICPEPEGLDRVFNNIPFSGLQYACDRNNKAMSKFGEQLRSGSNREEMTRRADAKRKWEESPCNLKTQDFSAFFPVAATRCAQSDSAEWIQTKCSETREKTAVAVQVLKSGFQTASGNVGTAGRSIAGRLGGGQSEAYLAAQQLYDQAAEELQGDMVNAGIPSAHYLNVAIQAHKKNLALASDRLGKLGQLSNQCRWIERSQSPSASSQISALTQACGQVGGGTGVTGGPGCEACDAQTRFVEKVAQEQQLMMGNLYGALESTTSKVLAMGACQKKDSLGATQEQGQAGSLLQDLEPAAPAE